ncbi:Sensor_kinase_SpoOB-type, alpha-helical domain [Desulforamulus putei DSM 12395]|uniref:Sensor_kinase_SpoOB-type, alpha-helical domain n=1 Tax=Desulforamulus putei DSM 12395 TaxID=1121429 RepID=A0A1M4U9M6_9FIRM|nr:Spo0B domain-containing protein [Desulforamulus putei]SHE53439.1 Sensor_kinase_SpoOB-type, alpha-helical domain [Desulforamulus putei DSM 12395]
MEIKGLLEVIQVQRHDFLNHLQVISGLLQLNKGERVRDYINQVCGEYERLSRITRLKPPEVKAVLLIANNEAAKCQVDFKMDIETNMASLDVPGQVVGAALDCCFKQALKFLAPPEVTDRRMKLTISEGERKITIKLGFPGIPAEVVKDAEEQMALSQSLAPYNSSARLAVTDKEVEIYMVFPRRSSNNP